MFNEYHRKQSTSSLFLHQAFDFSGMGTRLELNFNPLATSGHSSYTFKVQRVNEWHHFEDYSTRKPPQKVLMSTGLDKLQQPMNKVLQKGDVDAIKKTMQIHEHVFKNQVKELHRLYNVQKRLMEEARKESKQNTLSSSGGGGLIFNLQSLRERSGSCSGDNNMRMSRGFDLERPAAEEDMSTGVSTVDEEQAGPSTSIVGDVELSLSMGGGSTISEKRSKSFVIQKNREIDSCLSFKSERGEECSDPMSSSSETKRPHWLFQSLKLK